MTTNRTFTMLKPDGDALGASLALCNYLKASGKNATVVVPSEFPDFLAWMKGSKEVIDFIRSPKIATEQLNKSDLIFCLDFNDPRRVEKMQNALMQTTAPKILIDHHLNPVNFCNYTFSFLNFGGPSILSSSNVFISLIDSIL